MPDVEKFLKLYDLQDEAFLRLQLQVTSRVLDGLLELKLTLPGHVQGGKEVGNEAEEDRVIVRDDLGQVEVAKGSHQDLD